MKTSKKNGAFYSGVYYFRKNKRPNVKSGKEPSDRDKICRRTVFCILYTLII